MLPIIDYLQKAPYYVLNILEYLIVLLFCTCPILLDYCYYELFIS